MGNNRLDIQNSYICFSTFKGCRNKIINKDVIYCGFFNSFVKLGKSFKIEELRICPELKDKLLYHDYLADKAQAQSKEFLTHVKIGEIVYCTTEMINVVVLKKPKNKFDGCQYRTFEGGVREASAPCFRRVSLGTKCAEYKTAKVDDLNACEILAREYGFRVEKITFETFFLLRIYGDTQEEVDQFVTSLKNNYFIY
ncbi:hypothetical protein LCGC14_0827730 [marine sediment metagenome]|uniref:Uncharacterized protein n=1 Tax=marine sediment metagenome TaxID=412755 RepID=A0A0F9PGU8_9ZZZZ|nr:MAG: hypothetical protein Lokiarch_38610 [Candidatus Lokiarchaeum sp. GC14_75]HEA70539.1 hypothetical protein [archaeon]